MHRIFHKSAPDISKKCTRYFKKMHRAVQKSEHVGAEKCAGRQAGGGLPHVLPFVAVELHRDGQAVTLQNGGYLLLHGGGEGLLSAQKVVVVASADQLADFRADDFHVSGRNECECPPEAVGHADFFGLAEEPAGACSRRVGKQGVDEGERAPDGGQVAGCEGAEAFAGGGAIGLEAEAEVFGGVVAKVEVVVHIGLIFFNDYPQKYPKIRKERGRKKPPSVAFTQT